MRKKIKLLILLAICAVFINVVMISAEDGNLSEDNTGGNSGNANTGYLEGGWLSAHMGIRVSIIDSNGNFKKKNGQDAIKIILNSDDTCSFSKENKPKTHSSGTINWSKNVSYEVDNEGILKASWYKNSSTKTYYSIHEILIENKYSKLKRILEKYFSTFTLSNSDYILVEPMVHIGKYSNCRFGTAYEFANTYSLSSTSQFYLDFTNALFGGSTKATSGGVFWQTVYYYGERLNFGSYYLEGYEYYLSSEGLEKSYSSRNSCFKSSTCGRGIGVYKYSDVNPPEKKTCENQFDENLSMIERINLYNELKDEGIGTYRGLLDMSNRDADSACTSVSVNNDYTKSCLKVEPTSSEFTSENLSMYNEKIGDNIFCQVTFGLENNLRETSFGPVKAGQPIISTNMTVATATLTRVCYNYGTGSIPELEEDDYSTYAYEDLVITGEGLVDDIILDKIIDIGEPLEKENKIEQSIKIYYTLPTMYASNKDGRIYYSKETSKETCPMGESCKKIGNAIISKFNLKKDTYSFWLKSSVGDSVLKDTLGPEKKKTNCTYTVEEGIIPPNNKLNLVFRTIDTNSGKAFLSKTGSGYRNMGSNWGDLSEEKRKKILEDNNNSYNRNGEKTALYTITLTPSVIKDIRAYNKTTSYDDYNMICDDKGELCVSKFLTDLNSTYIKDKVKVLELYESENRKWYKELNS